MTARRPPALPPAGFWSVAAVMLRSAMLIGVALLLVLVVLPAALDAAGAARFLAP